MTNHGSSNGYTNAGSIFDLVGLASLFVCVAWLLQAHSFAGSDAKGATVLWTLMAAAVAGSGSALLYLGRCRRAG